MVLIAIWALFSAVLGRVLAALGRSWALLGRPWDACWALRDARGRFWTLLGALGALLGGFEVGFGRVWGGSGKGLGWVLQQASSSSSSKARKQFHMIVLALVCLGMRLHDKVWNSF